MFKAQIFCLYLLETSQEEGAIFGVNVGRPIVTNGGICGVIVRKCMNRLSCRLGGELGGPGIGVLDGVPHAPSGRKVLGIFSTTGLNGVFECILKEKCIRLVREKWTVFSYGQYITGSVIYSSFLRCTLLRDRNWHLREIC